MPRVVRLGFGRATIQREVDEELAFHLQMRTEQLIAAGLSAEDANREALRQFGNLPGVRHHGSGASARHETSQSVR